jgi:hypothetical protein
MPSSNISAGHISSPLPGSMAFLFGRGIFIDKESSRSTPFTTSVVHLQSHVKYEEVEHAHN